MVQSENVLSVFESLLICLKKQARIFEWTDCLSMIFRLRKSQGKWNAVLVRRELHRFSSWSRIELAMKAKLHIQVVGIMRLMF